jgi:hypothetical protein
MGSTAENLLDLLPKTLDRLGGQLILAIDNLSRRLPDFHAEDVRYPVQGGPLVNSPCRAFSASFSWGLRR